MQYVLLAAGTYLTARSQVNASKAQEIQYKEQAKDEQSNARDREIERKRRLVSALSSQAAAAGQMGVDQTVGSRKAISMEDVRQGGYDSQTDSARTNRRALLLRKAGRDARTAGNLQAAGTIINAADTARKY